MDSRAFDELSRRLAEKTSRGRALKLFGGALVGTFVGAGSASAGGPPQKHCKFARYSCRRNIDCCSNNCCNRICCDDGMTCCGGECIRCPAGQTVDPNTCECVGGTPGPVCGNGVCESGESCTSCPQDCGDCPPTCPNGVCDAGETCQTCPEDCGPCPPECGDGFCDQGAGETCANCPQDCGQCPPQCGDGFCDQGAGETCANCPQDCGQCPGFCGDGNCDQFAGEDCFNCPADCCPGMCPAGSDFCVANPLPCNPANPNCFCGLTAEGTSACVDVSGEACPTVPECLSSAECPAGEVCLILTPNPVTRACCADFIPTPTGICIRRC
jgi:hypothetical protein